MPFTFTHPSAVLPFNYLPKRWISFSALVIGSITPDFEYFIRMIDESFYSHTWAGLFWLDLPLGFLLWLLYHYVVKEPLLLHLPLFLSRKFNRHIPRKRFIIYWKRIPVVFCSLLIGALTHLVWDKLTHHTAPYIETISRHATNDH